MARMTDGPYFTSQAHRCRRLAKHADEGTAKALTDLADEYEAKAIKLDQKPD